MQVKNGVSNTNAGAKVMSNNVIRAVLNLIKLDFFNTVARTSWGMDCISSRIMGYGFGLQINQDKSM
jgi:hypothetical protein